ncbi:DUF397 domain-containing protein [Actinophytocola xinjiangensis]|nr:DUF397 domain-containing protein [Actinophytocola xinjiangensis]
MNRGHTIMAIHWRKSSFSGGGNNACVELGLHWRKSSFSGGENSACVELGMQWRKSSFSGGENNECVELVGTLDAVRDSKNPEGPVLLADLRGLLHAVRENTLRH